jgi:hypothetical protein
VTYRSVSCFISLCAALPLSISAAVPDIKPRDITPRVGLIEVYGTRKVSPEKVKAALGAKPGDPMPSRLDAEDRIDKVSGVVVSRVEAACCDGKNMVLYIGIEERDAPHIDYHPIPTGDVALPADLFADYRAFLDEVAGSIRGRNADEDLTQGYSLMEDPECRRLQQLFIPVVAANLALVDRVLRESADPEQRAAAAYLLQYGPREPRAIKTIVNGLQYGLRDDDDNVRENAMRALKAVAVGAKLHPEQQIHLEPTWFVELMNSVVWSDRRDATRALVNLTENHDADTLALLRERALPSVIEMARWHDMRAALPAFILAGRLAGLDEAAIKTAWVNGDREAVLKRALNPNGKHSAFSSVLHRSEKAPQ